MIDLSLIPWFLPLLLYAETHYRFRYFFSYLRKAEPELVADAPHFIEANQPLPLMILSKDAHRYPCTLQQVHITISQGNRTVHELQLLPSPVSLGEPLWWRVFTIQVEQLSGWIELDVSLKLTIGRKTKTYRNDNYRTSSHKPLRVYIAHDPLPRFEGLHWGDCHTHSNLTDDQVEFGAPMEASVQLCKSMGLSFFCVTDHSYDLDDRIDDYLCNDPELPKWTMLQKMIETINAHEDNVVVIRGEEVSCRNSRGENVHMLLLGNGRFFPGSGDSAEHWFKTRSELCIAEVLAALRSTDIAVAAHPHEPTPVLQRLLLGRGGWHSQDYRAERLIGIQFANGAINRGFEDGYREWISCLLEGKRMYAFGGNDAHGNFNRFRQIGIPFLLLKENDVQLFGKMMTGIYSDSKPSEDVLLRNLRLGRSIISDGPAINIRLSEDQENTRIGSVLTGGSFRIEVTAESNSDFGEIKELKVLKGCTGGREEELLSDQQANRPYSVI
ncbi:MAG: hypothetical protein ACRDGA_06870, partial [Bacteroidota bacterium]